MQKHIIKILFLSVIIFIITNFVSCYTYKVQSTKSKNLAYMYNPNDVTLHPEYFVFNSNDKKSELNVRILKKELFFVKTPGSNNRFAHIKIQYKIYDSFKTKNIIDSASFYFDFKYSITKDTIDLAFEVNLPKDSTYSALIKLKDINRERTEKNYLFIDKRTYAHENIKFTKVSNNKTQFHNWLEVNSLYKLSTRYKSKVYACYFNNNMPPALPPYSTANKIFVYNKPDSIFKVNNDTVRFNKEGTYLLTFDTTKIFGTSIIVESKYYPDYKTPSKLIQPIRYISTKKEYKRLLSETNKKIALDKYWLNKAGSVTRAKRLINIFYTRVQLANYYFTSYKAGWKTDKGIIYTIFGNPTYVYKSDNLEKWIYGENQTNTGIVFLFERVKANGIPNDYKLVRSPDYKPLWFQAVDSWRNGRAFAIVN